MFVHTFIISLIFFSFSATASRERGQIDSIERGKNGESHLIFLGNGRVLFLDPSEKELLEAISVGVDKQYELHFKTEPNKEITSVQNLERPPRRHRRYRRVMRPRLPTAPFVPTLVSDLNIASQLFQEWRTNYQEEAQCYNMAHVWAYEEYKRSNLNSMKLFMFFTSSYIRRYSFPWWFHVAPVIYVKEEDKTSRIVMDRRYTTFPMPIKQWSDLFIGSKRECKEVTKYSSYKKNSKTEDCFLIETSMHSWQPRDIRRRDSGREKRKFIEREVNWAYKEAF